MITAPRPGDQNGLYQLAPVLSGGTDRPARPRPVTQIERDLSSQATVAGHQRRPDRPRRRARRGARSAGVLLHPPLSGRSSIGIDAAGAAPRRPRPVLRDWQGTGQRRPLDGLNQAPAPGQVVLFTPAYGVAVPRVTGSAEVMLQPFPAAAAEHRSRRRPSPRSAQRRRRADPARRRRPAGDRRGRGEAAGRGAGRDARDDAADPAADVGRRRRPRSAAGRCSCGTARRSSARSRTSRTTRSPTRTPRAGVGQLADGRIILVAVDGDQPGYSAGMTSFELAQTCSASARSPRRRSRPAATSPWRSTARCSTARAARARERPVPRRCSSSTSASTRRRCRCRC